MTQHEITLSGGDRKLIPEHGVSAASEIGIQIGIKLERARVVTLIDDIANDDCDAYDGLDTAAILLALRATILAGHQEVNK